MSAPWYRKPLCRAGLCQSFRTEGDENGVWGECGICQRRVGYVCRGDLDDYEDALARNRAAQELAALAALIRRPPLDDVTLKQDAALRIAAAIDEVIA